MAAVFTSPGGIFICYRREDAAWPAGRLFDRLVAHFGEAKVFMDIDRIQPGNDFTADIAIAIGSCSVFLALIGDRWLAAADDTGRRRVDDPGDFVRLEIETALQRNVRVIPVLLGGTRMPAAAELPTTMQQLTQRHAVELNPSRFTSDTSYLLQVLDETVGQTAARTQIATVQPRRAASNKNPRPAGTAHPTSTDATSRDTNATFTTLTRDGLPSGSPGSPIKVGSWPTHLAITPDGTMALVTNNGYELTPIMLASGRIGTPIEVGGDMWAIAIAPDSRMAYVTHGRGWIAAVDLAAGKVRRTITIRDSNLTALAITPDGSRLYTSSSGNTIYPIWLRAVSFGFPAISLRREVHVPQRWDRGSSWAIAITPDGTTAYVARNDWSSYMCELIPISLGKRVIGTPIKVGRGMGRLAITPDGAAAYVVNSQDGTLTPVDLRTAATGAPIQVGKAPHAIAITPDGTAAYIANSGDDTVMPVSLSKGVAGAPIKVGSKPEDIAITPDGRMAIVTNRGDGTITPITISRLRQSANMAH